MAFYVVSGTDLSPEQLQRHILCVHLDLRAAIGIIGVAFPFFLWIVGHFYARLPLQDSMSAYYHAAGFDGRSMRDWFVGLLFALGISLYLYKGFGRPENWALNVAGAMAVAVAVIPEPRSTSWITAHGFCAMTFFLCIAYVALFCADNTLQMIHDTNIRNPAKVIARLKLIYRVIGCVMVCAIVVVYILNTAFRTQYGTFWVEAGGVLPFGAFWLVKSWELRRTGAELKTVRGETRKTAGRIISIERR